MEEPYFSFRKGLFLHFSQQKPHEKGFVLRHEQKSLTYLNSDDDILGRSLYDQEDVSDDYQIHVIYLLAKDSENYKSDVKVIIEKILSGNVKSKQKAKDNKKFGFDMTKEGKLDVGFLRVDKTKKQS